MVERIEESKKHSGTNAGRPVAYYQQLMLFNGFNLTAVDALPIQVSYLACGVIRRLFNKAARQEGS